MDITSFLDQIERVEKQNLTVTDPVLKRENIKTIRHLHSQYRKATRHRKPWYGLIWIVLALFIIFFAATFALLKFTANFGFGRTAGASGIAAAVLVILIGTGLLVLRLISADAYQKLIDSSFGLLKALAGQAEPESGTTPSKANLQPKTPVSPQQQKGTSPATTNSAPQVIFGESPEDR